MAFEHTDEDGDSIKVTRSFEAKRLLVEVTQNHLTSEVYVPFSQIPALIKELAGYLG
ncbi:hypothetical protein SEA_NEDARYA_74 [Gordonia phage Nedarya]|nr:hypothetical protein SEA_NEDARYA_74 [Gordonia phage Nedarya]